MLNYYPDLNRLRVFYFVYITSSITKASKELYVTKSAVSQAIKQLEYETNQKLFIRKGRVVVPTNEAKSLFEIVEPFLESVESRYSSIAESVEPRGLIRLSAPPLFGSQYILPCVEVFKRKYPKIRFQLNLTASIAPLHQLEEDKIDFCIVDSFDIMFGQRRYLSHSELRVDPEYIVCSKEFYQECFNHKPTYSQIIESNFISYHPDGAEICAWLENNYGKAPKRIKPAMVVDTPQLMLYGIKKHMGMGLVPVSMIKKELQKGVLKIVGGKKAVYLNKISLVRLAEKKESKAQSLFVAYLKERIKKVD